METKWKTNKSLRNINLCFTLHIKCAADHAWVIQKVGTLKSYVYFYHVGTNSLLGRPRIVRNHSCKIEKKKINFENFLFEPPYFLIE